MQAALLTAMSHAACYLDMGWPGEAEVVALYFSSAAKHAISFGYRLLCHWHQ